MNYVLPNIHETKFPKQNNTFPFLNDIEPSLKQFLESDEKGLNERIKKKTTSIYQKKFALKHDIIWNF